MAYLKRDSDERGKRLISGDYAIPHLLDIHVDRSGIGGGRWFLDASTYRTEVELWVGKTHLILTPKPALGFLVAAGAVIVAALCLFTGHGVAFPLTLI